MELRSTITCPICGHAEDETMPTESCQFFYACKGCRAVLRPQSGDSCAFRPYGSVPCPPVQRSRGTSAMAVISIRMSGS